ncbi:MAG TPA: GntR family transcriptional regulator [Chloroflexota bacterium]|nr:GntR family transcriptional regulator [Chloroflexota bacterium]
MTEPLDAAALAAALKGRGGLPLHSQLETTLRSLMESGQVPAGSILPGELDLAAQLGVSRHTVRHALGVLTSEGLLRRERGRGTTVVSPAKTRVFERSLSTFYAFAWEVRDRGGQQQSYILERKVIVPDSDLRERLALETGAEVERIVRLRSADGDPLVLETAYLARALTTSLTDAVLERESIYDELERVHMLRITRARESIRPILLSRPVARLLHAAPGAPAFSVERTTWTNSGPIEWQESIIRGDRYLYSVELPRV